MSVTEGGDKGRIIKKLKMIEKNVVSANKKIQYFIPVIMVVLAATSCNSGKRSGTPSDFQDKWSVNMAEYVMAEYDSLQHYVASVGRWQYDIGLLGMAIDRLNSVDEKYGRYMKDYIDRFVDEDGHVNGYWIEEYNIDHINPAKNLITLYLRTGEEKYRKAMGPFIQQMETHPKTESGGYWHKKKYPWQMWLDGIYMASPFLTRYAYEFDQPKWYDVVTHQFKLIYKKTLDEETGLLYHAWDESKSEAWSNPVTGQSKHFWSRAMGWYMMALVDVLEYLPEDHPDYESLIQILQNTSDALIKVRDTETGLWYQVLDQGDREGNYLEGSGSAMFIYAFAKGAKKGYLDESYLALAQETFRSLVDEFIEQENGTIRMTNIVGGCGLGGTNPYRDGSYNYYVNEKRVVNDPKGVGPFILAAIELDMK